MTEEKNKYDLEQRLISFAILIIKVAECLNNSYPSKHISKQITRSGTSPALNYGEVKSAESRNDFIHKIKVILKELRETFIALKIINQALLTKNNELVNKAEAECNELIAIFVKSVDTAQKNKVKTNLSV